MPSYNAVWIPTVAVAYTLALALLIYAWEHMYGSVSRCLRRSNSQNDTENVKKRFPSGVPVAGERNRKNTQIDQDVAIDLDRTTLNPVELSWENVSCVVYTGDAKGVKTVLQKSRGSFLPGEFVALMGPSGAGKSTMLDVLAGRKVGQGVEGVITLNGHVLTRELANRCISYVGQEDVFMPTMSTWESLLFVTQLCMEPALKSVRAARMDAVLEQMGLLKVKHSKVGGPLPGALSVRGLSGGEQRRLSIACGLVGNPSILFLDEPTTGLDAHSALAVMDYLHSLAGEGHTIVSTIHQPRQEIFSSFDKLLVLSEGYQIYLAPPSYVLRWFSEVLKYPYDQTRDGTVSDWLMSIVAVGFKKSPEEKARQMSTLDEVKAASERFGSFMMKVKGASAKSISSSSDDQSDSFSDEPQKIAGSSNDNSLQSSKKSDEHTKPQVTEFEEPTAPGELAIQEGTLYARSWWVQFAILWKRSTLFQLRSPAIAANRLAFCCLGGILIGLAFIRINDVSSSTQERLSLLFFALMMYCLIPFGWQAFALGEKRFFALDAAKGLYSPSAYFMAYVFSNLPFLFVNGFSAALIAYGLAGLRHGAWAVLQMGSIMALQSVISTQFVTGCLWFFAGQDIAFSIASLYISFSLLISGFFIRVSDMTLSVAKGLSWASFNKYSFQALARTELGNRQWAANVCPAQTNPNFVSNNILCSATSNEVLEYYDYKLSVPTAVGAMLGFWGLFCLFSYWALLRLTPKR